MRTRRKSGVETQKPAQVRPTAALDPNRLSTLDQIFSAVILAGGNSSRMGRDKAWLEVDGQRLLARQLDRVRAAGAAEVFISGRADTNYSEFSGQVVRDQFAGAGPLAGIERALAATTSPLLLVLAVDLAAMGADFLRRLMARCPPQVGVVPRVNGRLEPLAAIYPKSAHALARAQLENGKFAVRDFAERCGQLGFSRFIELPARESPHFANWNSPAELKPGTN